MSARKRMPSYRLWGSTEDGEIEFESLTDDTLEGALRVLREDLLVNESVCKGVDLLSEPGASEELVELCLDAAKDGISVVAVEVATGKVVGVVFNKIQVQSSPNEKSYFEKYRDEKCKHKSAIALMDFMIDVDSQVDLAKHYNVDCILEIMFLGTLQSHTRRRIGELLVSSSLEIGKELKKGKNVRTPVTIHGDNRIHNGDTVPALASAIMASTFSKKIAMKLGFDVLYEISYDECEFEGKKYSERIGDAHRSAILVAKRL